MNKILILGNGFNADLGLKVDYKDYFESHWYAELSDTAKDSGLMKYIDYYGIQKNNYNIEKLLNDYVGQLKSPINATNDKNALFTLEKSFSKFVDESIVAFNKDSCAFKVLSTFIKQKDLVVGGEYWIYSFCYTNFDKIRIKLSENDSLSKDLEDFCNGNYNGNPLGANEIFIDFIHGRSDNDRYIAILGLSEDSMNSINPEIKEAYNFVIKEKQPNYKICKKKSFLRSLDISDVISFFGFSFSDPDIPYFRLWLNTPKNFDEKRKINLYLRDNDDIENVLGTMRDTAKNNWDNFISHYDITKYTTQNYNCHDENLL